MTSLLSSIRGPRDLDKIRMTQLVTLATEIRDCLIIGIRALARNSGRIAGVVADTAFRSEC